MLTKQPDSRVSKASIVLLKAGKVFARSASARFSELEYLQPDLTADATICLCHECERLRVFFFFIVCVVFGFDAIAVLIDGPK